MARTITNNGDFPPPLLAALSKDEYTGYGEAGGDISVTRLILPPRITTLRKFHNDEIVEDAADRIWSVMGQAGHKVLENSAAEGMMVEKRLKAYIDGLRQADGSLLQWALSGQSDLYYKNQRAIYDYKFTSVWSLMFGDKPEWERQVNLQAMLHRYNGDEVEQGYIVALLRDWQQRRAKYEKSYPSCQAKVISLPMWPQNEVIDYAQRRVRMHQKAQADYIESEYDDSVLPVCTPEERWYRGATFKVKKMDSRGKINKKADRVFSDRTGAQQFISDNQGTLPKGKSFAPIEEAPGQNIRCESYCDVWKWCKFGREVHAQMQPEVAPDPSEENEEMELGI